MNSNFKKMWENLSIDEINKELKYCQTLIDIDTKIETKHLSENFDTKSCDHTFVSKIKNKYIYIWNAFIQNNHIKDESLHFCLSFLKQIIQLKEKNVSVDEALTILKESSNE